MVSEDNNFKKERERLISNLVSQGYLKTPKIIRVFKKVERHNFVREQDKNFAYADYPLSIPCGQTISAPHMCAIMLELLELGPGERVLEVGAGSGYNAALMAELIGKSGKIYSIELDQELSVFAKNNLESAGYKNVEVILGDGALGYPKEEPYDKIIVTCAVPEIPELLIEQLKSGGILLAPVGSGFYQILTMLRKTKDGLKRTTHGGCAFVPLRR